MSPRSVEREALGITAEIPLRVERLAVQRTVVVVAGEGVTGRIGIISELAVTREHFDASIEPRATRHVNAGAALLIGHVRAARAINSVTVRNTNLLLGGGISRRDGNGGRDDGNRREQHG